MISTFLLSINLLISSSYCITIFNLVNYPGKKRDMIIVILETLTHPFMLSVHSYQRLAAGEWFTARVSSCGLFHIAYLSAPEALKAELRSIYGQLCQDDMPMVRRSAASNLGKFAAKVEQSHLKTDIMSLFEDLTHDGTFMHSFPDIYCL